MALTQSTLVEVTPDHDAEVRLEQGPDGGWALTDDLHGAGAAEPALFTLTKDQVTAARALLEQYLVYSLPFRMAQRCGDLPGALQVRLLECPVRFTSAPTEVEISQLPEVSAQSGACYELVGGREVLHPGAQYVRRHAACRCCELGRQRQG